jgi:hypothetical protein
MNKSISDYILPEKLSLWQKSLPKQEGFFAFLKRPEN